MKKILLAVILLFMAGSVFGATWTEEAISTTTWSEQALAGSNSSQVHSGDVYPDADDTYNIGYSTSRWKTGYFVDINVLGDVTLTGYVVHTTSITIGNSTYSIEIDTDTDINGDLVITGTLDTPTINTGNGDVECFAMNQDVETTDAVVFTTINTGQGATEVYLMNQNVRTTDGVTFAIVTTASATVTNLSVHVSTHASITGGQYYGISGNDLNGVTVPSMTVTSLSVYKSTTSVAIITDASITNVTAVGAVITKSTHSSVTADDYYGIDTDMVNIPTTATPPYDKLNDWIDTTQSVGEIDGGAITDNADGTVSIASGTCIIKTTDSEIGVSTLLKFSADASVELVNHSINYVLLQYSGGTSSITATSNFASINFHDEFVIGYIYRDGNNVDILDAGNKLPNAAVKDCERLFYRGAERMTGGVITEVSTRAVSSTAGIFYLGQCKIETGAVNSLNTDFENYYYRTASSWTVVASTGLINNTQYDDGSGTLATLTAQRYGVHWVYICFEGDINVVFGQGDYTLNQGEQAQPPGSIPDYLAKYAVLAAKVMVQKGASTFESIDSAYAVNFVPTTVSNHNDLGNIDGGAAGEYYHLKQSSYTDLTDGGVSTAHYHDEITESSMTITALNVNKSTTTEAIITNASVTSLTAVGAVVTDSSGTSVTATDGYLTTLTATNIAAMTVSSITVTTLNSNTFVVDVATASESFTTGVLYYTTLNPAVSGGGGSASTHTFTFNGSGDAFVSTDYFFPGAFAVPYNIILTSMTIWCSSAPEGANIVINWNGYKGALNSSPTYTEVDDSLTLFSLVATATGTTIDLTNFMSSTTWSKGERWLLGIDTIGSGEAGTDVSISIQGYEQ